MISFYVSAIYKISILHDRAELERFSHQTSMIKLILLPVTVE